MDPLREEIEKVFGNKLRLRVCGICTKEDSVLLIKHKGIGDKGFLWAPPGGGMEYGESALDTLKREFVEETGLEVEVNELLFVNEYFKSPIHALELFFKITPTGGTLSMGSDPEISSQYQIIHELAFIPFSQIKNDDPELYHNIFRQVNTFDELMAIRGYYKDLR
jgi:8-oxo-dGTP diphosphatase